ncbi:Gfo/Idh/MocA family protein [Microbacterium aoyamense]|uniref:Gfo/Idh/MocA family protein n=1 Tax=Microbacterium aoyamense TaxID=344166 RepID=UPI00200583B4|nr:Gfo/Idh/MocA family oxidoreductase [Microbacterium aoyamense]
MTERTAAVIAAGSQGRVHARGWSSVAGVRLAAIADPIAGAAAELAGEYDGVAAYDDATAMLQELRPEFVSVCTPPSVRLDVVRAAIAAGARAIHAEKPIATSYGDALAMVAEAQDAGVQLTFNLQRRFEPVHRFARSRIVEGAIGDIVSIEGYCPNLPDWGTHIFDLILFYLGDEAPEWVIGQVDVTVNRFVYGAFAETSSLTQVKWPSNINAVVMTGREPQTPVLNLANNTGLIVQGTSGRIESRGSRCLVQRFGADDELFPTPHSTDASTWERGIDPAIFAATAEAIADLVDALDTGREPVLSARRGLAGAELIFATYESSRSRRRVILPLDLTDNPLLDGLAQGFWAPTGEQRSTY